jgi:16S rRNA (guanine(966)-N(2))-methyltransferase RsmD
MRIISGTAKGRRLLTAKGLAIRPTYDKVKESLFNIIGEEIIGTKFLDLFAGTGSIGLEALSRGAQYVIFVEKNAHHVEIIRKNLYNCNFSKSGDVYCGDVLRVLQRLNRLRKDDVNPLDDTILPSPTWAQTGFNFIFVDPPYKSFGLVLETLKTLDSSKILAKNGRVIIEHVKTSRQIIPLPEELSTLVLFRQRLLGDTVLSFYK